MIALADLARLRPSFVAAASFGAALALGHIAAPAHGAGSASPDGGATSMPSIERVEPDVTLLDAVTATEPCVLAGGPFPSVGPPDDLLHPNGITTSSGLVYRPLHDGCSGGGHPDRRSVVEVRYAGWSSHGVPLESGHPPERVYRLPVRQLIRGWGEAMENMVVGDRFRFWIPAQLAYGTCAAPRCGDLVFDIELLGFEPAK